MIENKVEVFVDVVKEIKELDYVLSVIFVRFNKEENFVIIMVVFIIGLNDVVMKDLVKDVCSLLDKNGVDLFVIGLIVVNIDILDCFNDVILVFVVFIVGFVFVLLIIVFCLLFVFFVVVVGFILMMIVIFGICVFVL